MAAYTFWQQLVSAFATALVLALGLAVVALIFGGAGVMADAVQSSSNRELSGTVSLAIIAALLFAALQQTMLRVVIFRK